MKLGKPAPVDHPVHDLIRDRFSPRAFADQPVGTVELASLFEAARWAASCGNSQPWSFVYAHRGTANFQPMLECLKSGNQVWAKDAAVLVISVARLEFVKPGKPDRPNPHAYHDVGLATAQLALQATALGLAVHPMAGFDRDKTRAVLHIPEGFDPVAAIAVGHPGDAAALPDDLREREQAPRRRKPQREFVFPGTWPDR